MKLNNENDVDLEEEDLNQKKNFINEVSDAIKIVIDPKEVKETINTNREAGVKYNDIQVYKINFE